VTGFQLNAVIRHSVFSALLLFGIGMAALAGAVFHYFGATPHADDLSRYPLIAVPVLLAVAVYVVLIAQIVAEGWASLRWDLVSTAFSDLSYPTKSYMADGWPYWYWNPIQNAGLLHHILGTLILMGLTCLVAAPFGIGAGIYLSEYADGRTGQVIQLAITALRASSLLILGLTAYAIATATFATPLAPIFNGYYYDAFGDLRISQGGSFVTAGLVLALLVIPVIARTTEEGCRSLPQELREGSLALGASEALTLRRIVLPWALPNIVTGLILSWAEAGGSVTVIMLIAGRGQYGVGVARQVTSLAHLIYDTQYGNLGFQKVMKPYQGSAALLLLLITMGLGVLALLTKRWLYRHYRGG
jgi:phosphate transport system permease protein